MEQKRMNLFKGKFEKPKAAPKKIKLGFHVVVVIAFSGLIAVGMVFTYLGHKKTQNELKAKVANLESEAQKVIAETNQLAEIQIKKKRGAVGYRIKLGRERNIASASGIDPSWSALLWKLSAITGGDILLQSIDLNVGGKAAAIVAGRTLTLSGSATTLITMREWLSRMTKELPGYDFSIDSQTISESSAQNKFTVTFKVTARLI